LTKKNLSSSLVSILMKLSFVFDICLFLASYWSLNAWKTLTKPLIVNFYVLFHSFSTPSKNFLSIFTSLIAFLNLSWMYSGVDKQHLAFSSYSNFSLSIFFSSSFFLFYSAIFSSIFFFFLIYIFVFKI